MMSYDIKLWEFTLQYVVCICYTAVYSYDRHYIWSCHQACTKHGGPWLMCFRALYCGHIICILVCMYYQNIYIVIQIIAI